MAVIATLAVIDGKFKVVPNVIVLPAIGYTIWQTGNWEWAIIMFCIGALVYERKRWGGGDVKLMMLGGAVFGWHSIIAVGLMWQLLYLYRLKTGAGSLPVGPFFGISSVLTAII